MTLAQGSHLGPYEITAVIGAGGMGDVYRARDHRLGRDIAIKVLSEATAADPVSLSRFTQEAQAVAALNHPHIVTIFSTEEADGVRFMTMELIEGRTLARMIPEGGLSLSQFFDVAIAIADALSAAHQKHITHRDLTPVNVMVTSAGLVKVLDFGLARGGAGEGSGPVPIEDLVTRQRLTGAGTILGTMPYMSPEQVEAKPLDPRTDIFSFGVVLYEMATGVRPFRGDTKPALMSSIMREHPKHASELRRDLPAEVSRLIGRCLEKDPRDRLQTAQQILLELRSMRRAWESGVTAPSPRRTSASAWPWAAGIAIAASLAVVSLRGQRPPPAPTSSLEIGTRLIVVLPFLNVTKDPADEVFAEGLLETLTSSLSQTERFPRALRVVPASEVRSEGVSSVREARQTFGALLAITGSVQRLATSARRLTLNLVDAGRLEQLASRTIDITEEAGTQETLLGAVVALLAPQLPLSPEARKAMTAGGSDVARAYALFSLGRGYLIRFDRAENIDKAIASLSGAVAIDPRYALAHTALGEAYWRKSQATGQASWLDQAADQCLKALTIDNRLADVHVTLAMIARERGRYEQALTFAQTAVELDPLSSTAYRELARAYADLKLPADAEATYRKAVDLRHDWLAYNRLGSFLLRAARPKEAEVAFQRVLELAPENTLAYNNLGTAYSAMGRPEEAESWWTRSMQIRPTNTAASNLGAYHYSLGRYAEAVKWLERAVTLPPESFRVWANLGAARYWSPGERSKAKDAYSRAVELAEEARRVNPRRPETLVLLADTYAILDQRARALDAATSVERLQPTDPPTLFVLASAYAQLGERDRALHWLQKAIDAGYSRSSIEKSPWLEGLRRDKRFANMTRSPP